MSTSQHYRLTHLQMLEAEAIHIMREVAAEFERPTLMFSGGKDSIVMVRLAEKAFRPAKFPFPLLHVDTGHNFPEALAFRDELVESLGERLIVAHVQDAIDQGLAVEDPGMYPSRNRAQIPTLLKAVEDNRFDALFGGARRDEEKARAKERIFSFRDEFGQWDPKNQRPELWNLYNAKIAMGEHIRVFPLSNWTEMDVWQYIKLENIAVPDLYFSHQRDVVTRMGQLMPIGDDPFGPRNGEDVMEGKTVRFRTVGDLSCTAATESPASTIDDIIDEVAAARASERGARMDDKTAEAAMEDRKKEGYFYMSTATADHREFSSDGYLNMELLRFLTCGSVDDGKSTLIGRLLYDSKSIFEDQLEAAEKASLSRGDVRVNLALLTDGLRAEREQGITIDVAYRYFATPKRKFIIADCPGHVQYTRNMVTGASTANLALILIDGRHGVIEQTRRHSFITSLLRIPHLVVCVNKMDLVDWSKDRFEEIRAEFEDFAARFEITDVTFIPMSALLGDNVVKRSENMEWYQGPSLLHHLENVHIAGDRDLIDPRFPVQWVIRPQSDEHHDYRGYGGEVAGGVFKVGDEVMALPGGLTSKVKSIELGGEPIDMAVPPMSVSIELEDDIDVSRGDMLCRPNNQPEISQDIEAMIVWMAEESMKIGKKYTIKHTTNVVRGVVKDLLYQIDIGTLSRLEGKSQLGLNEIGRVMIRCTKPLLADAYRQCRTTGSFVIVDEQTSRTVGAGLILK